MKINQMPTTKRANTLTGTRPPADTSKLESEIDQLVYPLYGLTEDEFAHILSTFPLVEE